jgi:hypothetical protein
MAIALRQSSTGKVNGTFSLVERLSGKLAMSNESLKTLSWACKILAVFFTVIIGLWILPPRWGFNPVADVQSVMLGILSLVPNRWLVFSRMSFVVFLIMALFPFHVLLSFAVFRGTDVVSMAVELFVAFCMFAPLPFSLVLSRIRFIRGVRFMYA